MITNIIVSLPIAIVAAVAVSGQSHSNDGQKALTKLNNTVMSKNVQPDQSGYANVNGLKM